MKSNDLRIGNWLNFSYKFKGKPQLRPVQVLELYTKFAIFKDKGGLDLQLFYNSDELKPILLTPEILQHVGFTRENNGWHINKSGSYMQRYFSLFDENFCAGKLDLVLNGSDMILPKVKHLHHLQNIYFALVGAELNIKW